VATEARKGQTEGREAVVEPVVDAVEDDCAGETSDERLSEVLR